MRIHIMVITTAVILILGGCSPGQANQSNNVEPAPATASNSSTVSPEVDQEVIEPVVAEPVEVITLEQPEKMNEPIIPNYHMTANYFIKPNNEQDNKKVVLLTFDDGPKEEQMLTSLLNILDKHEAKAIFFVNGYRVKQKPELLKLIHERDQIIGNHSWDHIILSKENKGSIDKQIGDVQTIVKDILGEPPLFFRPPNGAGNDDVRAKVKEEGMLYMTWSNGSLDWADNKNNPQGVIDSVMEQLLPGSNILMHELAWTVEALDELLTKIEDAGYSFIDPRAIELTVR
jgi:peptidoglycan/xylan/chitin deacetylase (PgdA/CDA1 family)